MNAAPVPNRTEASEDDSLTSAVPPLSSEFATDYGSHHYPKVAVPKVVRWLVFAPILFTGWLAAAQAVTNEVRQIGSWPGYARGDAQAVFVAGDRAYVATGDGGLVIFDVRQPAQPTVLGRYDTSGSARGIQVVGATAYVADDSAGLQILDVSNPAAVVRVGGYNNNGFATDVQVVGTIAYVADFWDGLQILDVGNPANVLRLGGFATRFAMRVQVVGTTAYVANFHAGLQILDVSNPAAVVRLGGYDTSGYAHAVHVVSTTAFVADGEWGLVVLDVGTLAGSSEASIHIEGGRALVEWTVLPGRYEFRTAGEVLNWQTRFQTNLTGTLFRYHDPEPAIQPARFYDLRKLPYGQ